MAILSKIRERSMFLIVIIGLALFAFVASPKDILDFFNSSKVNSVGEINGETIKIEDFASRVEAYKTNAGPTTTDAQAADAVWGTVLSEIIYQQQLEKAGVVVGEKDVWDAIIQNQEIQNAPIFKNEAGLFDEEKLKAYLANLKMTPDENGQNTAWLNWLENERNVKSNLEKLTYTKLVRAGIGASLKEAKRRYKENGTKLSGEMVFVPFSSINDSKVSVSNAEIETYVANHASEFKSEASRDLKVVRFDIAPSSEDDAEVKADLLNSLEGFKTAVDAKSFVQENESDIAVNDAFLYKKDLPNVVANEVFNAPIGTVVGPYKFQDHYNLSKVVATSSLPDSVQASHILISFAGSRSADQSVTRSEAEAKKFADSIATLVKGDASKFAEFAKNYSADKSNSEKGGELDWFTYNQMVPEFRDFAFTNSTGSVGVVKTIFGFHIVKVTSQKNSQKVIQLATIARKIEASEYTENLIFKKAETLAYKLTNGGDFDKLVKAANYAGIPCLGITEMQADLPGIGSQRGIVRWAFDSENEVKSVKRFDIETGHAVVVITNKSDKGLMSTAKAALTVKPILLNEKKAKLISEKMKAGNLKAIASANKTTVSTFNNVTMASPVLETIGRESGVVGAMYAVKLNKTVADIVGKNGVFAIKVTKKVGPVKLPNYEGARLEALMDNQRKISGHIFNALKELSAINDYRARIY